MKRFFVLLMIGFLFCSMLGCSENHEQSSPDNQNDMIQQSIDNIKNIFDYKIYLSNADEMLENQEIDLEKFNLSESKKKGQTTIRITDHNIRYLKFALIANQFIDDIPNKISDMSEKELIKYRNDFFLIIDEAKKLSKGVYQNEDLTIEDRSLIYNFYSDIFTKESSLSEHFPTDFNRLFQKNAESTKHFISTEYHSIPELTSKGPSFIQKIDDIIEKVENGTLSPQEGSNEINKIWDEWKNL